MDPYTVPPTTRPRYDATGVETKRLLLFLGAGCLVASLGAGTALIWSALGPGGQFAVMLAVTASLLVAVRLLRRLPATAEAVAVVGVAALVVDAVAARTLHLPLGTALSSHVYVGVAALVVGALSALVAWAAPYVSAPVVPAAVAPTVALVAWMHPTTTARNALLAPLALVIGIVVERALSPLERRALFARGASGVTVGFVVVGGMLAATLAAYLLEPAAWCGVVASTLAFALPELCGWRGRRDVEVACATVAGGGFAMVAIAAGTHVGVDLRLAAIAVLPAVAGAAVLAPLDGFAQRLRATFVTVATPVATAAFMSLHGSESSFIAVTASLSVACLAASLFCPSEMRLGLNIAASSFGSVAVALSLDLGGVGVVEAYVATPALWWTAIGTIEMRRRSAIPSTVLLPGLLIGVVPTLALALQPDTVRQVALLLVASAIVAAGAQLRWAAPMSVGAGVITVIVLRVVGPEVVHLPRWVTLAIVGAVLLTLGATWEARIADAQRLSAALRPRIAALR